MEKEKLDILINSFGNFFKSNDEYLFKCPKCTHNKRKLSVNIEKNAFKCWVCGYAGSNITNLVKKYSPYPEYSRWAELSDTVDITTFDDLFRTEKKDIFYNKVNLPEKFKTLTGKQAGFTSRHAINYLKTRDVGKDDILKWKMGYCATGEYEKRICIPSFDEDGELNYFVARSYAGQFPKYKNPATSKDIVFNDLYIDWDSPVVLVEGIFDAMKAANAVPLLGSSLSERSKLFQKIIEKNATIYMALDPDAKYKEQKIIKNLMEYDVKIYKININPYSDVGEMSKEEFVKRYKDASVVKSLDYLYQCLNF